MMKIYLIAGEPSGDLHGAHLVEALREEHPEIDFRGFGGHRMEAVGVRLDQTIDKLSFMGFTEVVKHLPVIWSNFRRAKKVIRSWKPDAIIYIDFPGFNMRMARWSRKQGYVNFYYIAPQAWAWKEKRALKLKRDVDEMFCILPFEKPFFSKFGYSVHYVGHPLVDIIREYKEGNRNIIKGESGDRTSNNEVLPESNKQPDDKIIALLPGSREQEVKKILPIQLQAIRGMNGCRFIIGKSPHVTKSIYDDISKKIDAVSVTYEEDTYALLSRAWIACVTSGTATLETALFKVPEVVCFKGSRISYYIARRLVKVSYISLVNLVMGKEVVKELIQQDLTAENLHEELIKLTSGSRRDEINQFYTQLEERLGIGGAAEKSAKIMISRLGS